METPQQRKARIEALEANREERLAAVRAQRGELLPAPSSGERDSVLTLGQFFQQLTEQFTYGGLTYGPPLTQTLVPGGQTAESVESSFRGFVELAYKRNGVAFACLMVRQLLFSEVRFQWQRLRDGKPADLFTDRGLKLLERPWTNATTRDLLMRMEQDATLAGNSFTVRVSPTKLIRLRPDWTAIMLGSTEEEEFDPDDPSLEPVAYLYFRGGQKDKKPDIYLPEQVAHYAPLPDPLAHFRGQSWLMAVINEILADSATVAHKTKFFDNGATPNMVVTWAEQNPDNFKALVQLFRDQQEGLANAYKTLHLAAGADAKPVGSSFKEIEFAITQAQGEARIAAASGMSPIVVGLKAGLDASTYSNYFQACRRVADGTLSPLWGSAAGALESIVNRPGRFNDGQDVRLWYDTEGIPFLQVDAKDESEIIRTKSESIRNLTDAGYEWESVVKAVTSGDLSQLKHTGLMSVQLLPAGTKFDPKSNGSTTNGTGPKQEPAKAGGNSGGAQE